MNICRREIGYGVAAVRRSVSDPLRSDSHRTGATDAMCNYTGLTVRSQSPSARLLPSTLWINTCHVQVQNTPPTPCRAGVVLQHTRGGTAEGHVQTMPHEDIGTKPQEEWRLLGC
jgi:hypothetical protein